MGQNIVDPRYNCYSLGPQLAKGVSYEAGHLPWPYRSCTDRYFKDNFVFFCYFATVLVITLQELHRISQDLDGSWPWYLSTLPPGAFTIHTALGKLVEVRFFVFLGISAIQVITKQTVHRVSYASASTYIQYPPNCPAVLPDCNGCGQQPKSAEMLGKPAIDAIDGIITPLDFAFLPYDVIND